MARKDGSATLDAFLEAAGRSLRDAQQELVGTELDAPANVAISEAELDVKVSVELGAKSEFRVRPISSSDISAGAVDPATLSSAKIRFVALADESQAPSPEKPQRDRTEVIAEVAAQEDLKAVGEILGGLTLDAVYVEPQKRWLVTAKDPEARIVREVVLPDRE